MTKFIITYFGGNPPKSKEEGQAHQQRYMEWLQALGDKAISPMNPIKNIHTLNKGKAAAKESASRMMGYTLIEASDIEEALSIAEGCPFLEIDGTLEVAELIEMG